MTKRNNNNDANAVLAICLLITFCIYLMMLEVIFYFNPTHSVTETRDLGIVIILLICTIARVLFWYTHQKPLSYNQIVRLSRRRAKKYARKKYHFKKVQMVPDNAFKSNLDSAGRWYSINAPLNTFPSLVATLLKGKHHEWVVVAIEKDGIITKMWANKGNDNQSVSLNCDINEILQMCKKTKSYSVLRFHNHPNSDPAHYTTLVASKQDRESARVYSDIVCRAGFNWFDFVCAQGDYIMFFSRISENLEIKGGSVSDIVDHIGITPQMDYRLQKEYYSINAIYGIGLCLIIVLASIISLGAKNEQLTVISSSVSETANVQIESTVAITTSSISILPPDSFLDGIHYVYDDSLQGYVVTDVEDIEVCIIPEAVDGVCVVAIGEEAFYQHRALISVTIPDTVVEIRRGAFNSCFSLESVNLPSQLTLIENDAFSWCAISEIEFPSTLASIGDYAFLCCNLNEVNLPEGVVSIGEGAFQSNPIVSVSLPNSLISIGKECFSYCSNLSSIRIPTNVVSIEDNMFWNSGLVYIELPANCQVDGLDSSGDSFRGPLCEVEIVFYENE